MISITRITSNSNGWKFKGLFCIARSSTSWQETTLFRSPYSSFWTPRNLEQLRGATGATKKRPEIFVKSSILRTPPHSRLQYYQKRLVNTNKLAFEALLRKHWVLLWLQVWQLWSLELKMEGLCREIRRRYFVSKISYIIYSLHLYGEQNGVAWWYFKNRKCHILLE